MNDAKRRGVAAAACVFAACAALIVSATDEDPAAAASVGGCPAARAAQLPQHNDRWVRTVTPGPHVAEVKSAAAALSVAGSALEVKVVQPDSEPDVVVTADRDLARNWIAQTRGCLKPGLVPMVATVTLDPSPPAGTDLTLSMTRQLAVAFGLGPDDHSRCSTMATNQSRTRDGCGAQLALLQPVDRAALIKIWGTPSPSTPTSRRAAPGRGAGEAVR